MIYSTRDLQEETIEYSTCFKNISINEKHLRQTWLHFEHNLLYRRTEHHILENDVDSLFSRICLSTWYEF